MAAAVGLAGTPTFNSSPLSIRGGWGVAGSVFAAAESLLASTTGSGFVSRATPGAGAGFAATAPGAGRKGAIRTMISSNPSRVGADSTGMSVS